MPSHAVRDTPLQSGSAFPAGIDPDIPVNDSFYRLVDIRTCPGSVVSARHPAAVAAGWEVAMQLCDLLFKALAPALPDRVLAGTKGCICNIALRFQR